MDKAIIMPRLWKRTSNNRQELLGGEMGYPDGANSFLARSFVVLTAGVLAAVASEEVLCLGMSPDESKADATINPPTQFFGDRHFPYNPKDQIFLISVSSGAGTTFGEANAAPQRSDITLGDEYGLLRPATGPHAGKQFLASDDTTTTLFVVVELPDDIHDGVKQNDDTFNPVVAVRIIESKIQIVL